MRELDPESFALVSGINWSDEENPLPNQAATNKPNVNTVTKPAPYKPVPSGPKSNNLRK
jgi:hypothetical protein